MKSLRDSRVAVLGVGGLGSIASLILARSGVGQMTLLDDDRVDISNLHRQVLYHEGDAGAPKAALAAERLTREASEHGHRLAAVAREIRALPDTICDLVAGHDLIIEGTDNFASKFMAADAARLMGIPVVQAGAVRWVGWALASRGDGGPCLRCIFEDIPRGRPETCAQAGVVGPVVGVLGAVQAGLCLRLLTGDTAATGQLHSYRGLDDGLRELPAPSNPNCPLCAGDIRDMDIARYMPPDCAA